MAVGSANLVWQEVKIALANADPFIVNQFRTLKAHLAQVKGNPNLDFIPLTDADFVAAGGTVVVAAACRLYGFYLKKDGTSGTGTGTDAWAKVYDDATNDGTAGDAMIALPLLVANDKVTFISGDGFPLATGMVVTGHTTLLGTTDSTATDLGNGFAIIG